MTYEDLLLRLNLLAKNVGRTLEPLEIDFYSEVFFRLNDEQIESLGDYFAECYKHRELPSIAEIEDYVCATEKPSAKALEEMAEDAVQTAIADIFKAIARHGTYGELLAKHELSPFAWNLVKDCGGWWHLCSADNKDLAVMKSHMRRLGRTLFRTLRTNQGEKIQLIDTTVNTTVRELEPSTEIH